MPIHLASIAAMQLNSGAGVETKEILDNVQSQSMVE